MKRTMKTSSRPPSHRAIAVSTAPRGILGAAAHNAAPRGAFAGKDSKASTSFTESLNSLGFDTSFDDENGPKPRTPSRGRSYASVAAVSPAPGATHARTPSPAQSRAVPRTPASATRRNSASGTGTPVRTPVRTPSRRSSSIRTAASEALAPLPAIVAVLAPEVDAPAIVAPVAVLPAFAAADEAIVASDSAPILHVQEVALVDDAPVHRVGGGFVSPSLASPPECVHAAVIAQQRVREWREQNRRSAAGELSSPAPSAVVPVQDIAESTAAAAPASPPLLPTAVSFVAAHECGSWFAPFMAYEFAIDCNDGTSVRVHARYTAFAAAYAAIIDEQPEVLQGFNFPAKRFFARSAGVVAERQAAFATMLSMIIAAATSTHAVGQVDWLQLLPVNSGF